MAEKKKSWTGNSDKSKSKTTNKTPKRPKDYEPGFFNEYGGNYLIITKRPKNDKK